MPVNLSECVEEDRRRLDLFAGGQHDRLRHPLEFGEEVLLELRHVETLELDLRWHPQEVEVLEDPADDVPGQECKWEERKHPDELAAERALDVVQARREAAGEDSDQKDSVETADPVDGHRSNRVVYTKLLLDPRAAPDGEHASARREQVR